MGLYRRNINSLLVKSIALQRKLVAHKPILVRNFAELKQTVIKIFNSGADRSENENG